MWSVTTRPCASLTSVEAERASAVARPISPAMRISQATSANAALLSARGDAVRHGIHDELDHVEAGQGQDALDDGERDRRQRPAGRDAPHQAQGASEVQDAAHADPGCLFSQRAPPTTAVGRGGARESVRRRQRSAPGDTPRWAESSSHGHARRYHVLGMAHPGALRRRARLAAQQLLEQSADVAVDRLARRVVLGQQRVDDRVSLRPSSRRQTSLPVSFRVYSSSSRSPIPAVSGTMTISPSISRATDRLRRRISDIARHCIRHSGSFRRSHDARHDQRTALSSGLRGCHARQVRRCVASPAR